MIEALQHFFESSSLMMRVVITFSLVLLAPRLFQKLKLPGVLAFIFIGVLFGPKGLHFFKENGQVLVLFAALGKLLLLFFSGLDIEIDVLKKNAGKSFLLASLSFAIPALGGLAIGLIFNYSLLTSIMLAVLFSSHSVIAYPILLNLGIAKKELVAVTIGATAITDIASLILFAVCLPIHTTGFHVGPFLLQLLYIIGFIPFMIFGFRWLGKTAFRHLGEDAAEQMIFLLVVIGISARVAELVNIEPIVGAFLAGLAVSTSLPNVGVRNQLDILGNTLFIPAFFISLGILIDPVVVIKTLREHFLLVVAVVLTITITKLLAAWLAGKKLNYSPKERALMGALTIPQVSSTLAVALVAYESLNAAGERLIDEPLLNSILVLMVVSTVAGTIMVEIIGKRILQAEKN
jgi:Kef-type K+ transport system membrane component KefB